MPDCSIEVFVDDGDGVDGVGFVLKDSSILEYEGELVPGCKLTPRQAMRLAAVLAKCAHEAQSDLDVDE